MDLQKIAADFDRLSAEAHGAPGLITWADVTPADLEDARRLCETPEELVDELVSRFSYQPGPGFYA
jgi:hypothetical protein